MKIKKFDAIKLRAERERERERERVETVFMTKL
jgi:hypothetical protein